MTPTGRGPLMVLEQRLKGDEDFQVPGQRTWKRPPATNYCFQETKPLPAFNKQSKLCFLCNPDHWMLVVNSLDVVCY